MGFFVVGCSLQHHTRSHRMENPTGLVRRHLNTRQDTFEELWRSKMNNQPNWPSKQEDQKSGGGRDNNPPRK